MSSTAIANTGLRQNDFIKAPNYVDAYDLGVSSANNLSLPVGAGYVELKANFDFYVKWGSTGVTTVSTATGGASELIPLQSGGIRRNIGSTMGTTAISVMSTGACRLTASWWDI